MTDLDDGQVEERDQPGATSASCALKGPNSHPCPVVAIGASAGGLEAFQELFRQMPADTGYAFVLLQHLSPRHETLIPELLAPLTPMPVRTVEEETLIEANHIYVMPPHGTLTIDDCVLYLSRPAARVRDRRSPIDRFFRSLAEDQEDEAVGIILSGTGTDGALGLKAIKERGGLTLSQAPETARYDSMPRSAVLTGAVDFVLPIERMPARMIEHLRHRRETEGQWGEPEKFREEVASYLGKICAILRRDTGHDFRRYKESTLVRRVRRRMGEARASSVYDYVEYLNQEPKEVEQLFRDLLISVTHFFRDPEAFELLAAQVIPCLFEGKDADGFVRVWVAGCATGEEAYSFAILLREHMAGIENPPQVQVFATDIDAQALETARQALYPEGIANQISPERLERYFVKHGNMYQVSRDIREMCLFSLHNLIADPPFSRLDLVSCRNVLIYLESDLQRKVVALFHYALRPGGYLFLGPSEMVSGQPGLFRTLDKKHRVFQSRDTVSRPPFRFPLSERGRLGIRPSDESLRRSVPRQQEVARTFETILLESYAPACVVVNESGDIVYFSPRTGRYLEPPSGTPTVNVVDMARKGLRLDIRTALHKAVNSRVPVVHENVSFELDGQKHHVNLIVRPMPELGDDPGLFMVVFQEVMAAPEGSSLLPAGPVTTLDDPIIRRLETELRSTKDHLQATLEELESSNEELVSSNEELLSMNEELQSANEELQTSKEELQSVNEELETVNAELKKKVDELDRVNSDLQNLFQSTRIATVFVDRELRIKKFTPAAVEVFRLIEGDTGRLIADIAPRFTGGDLVRDIQEVLRTLSTRERQVQVEEGEAWYLLRVLPYRTVEDVIDGVVLTFLDITKLKRTEEERERLAAIVDSSQDGIIGKTLDGVITSWNAGAERMYGYSPREAIGRTLDLIVPLDQRSRMADAFEKMRQGTKVEPFETVRVRKDGGRFDISLTFSPIHDANGQVIGASGIERDITEFKRAEQDREQLAAIVDSSQDGIISKTLDGVIMSWNAGAERMYGYSAGEMVGRTLEWIVPPDQRPLMTTAFEQLRQGIKVEPFETVRVRKDGRRFDISLTFSPIRDTNGRVIGASGIERDISERKQADEALRRSEGRLRRLVESDLLGVTFSDGEGNILETNDAFLAMIGYTREDLRAGRVQWREITPPEHLPLDDQAIAEAQSRGACTPYEKEYVRKDGSRVPILIGFALLEAPLPEFVCFILDLTAQKRLEEALRHQAEQLVEADRRKDEFLAMLGHELRNPLAPIRNCLHILQSPRHSPEQNGRALRTIDRQVLHLTRLVDDLLDIARISRGKILLRRGRIDLAELVRATMEDRRDELEEAGLDLTLELPDAPVWIDGDPTRVAQVFGNVLHNAGKFTDRGGSVAVSLQESSDPGEAILSVRDSGIGMEPDLLERVFEPFSQADRGPDRSRGGLGLGLALVKALVDLHGGAVEARSPGLGDGTEVVLRFPLADSEREENMNGNPKEDGAETPRRCLVIEDNADAAESMALLLRLSGHEAEMALDGSSGLETARSFRPDIVLCDIGLPGELDGYGVARAFRADPELRSAFLIALTGYGQEEDRRRALEAGFDAHLTKPADLEELKKLMARAR
jgi:two-component system CheB/CheR fusion protein